MGLLFWLFAIIAITIKKIYKTIRYFNVRSILTDENGNWFHCRHKIADKLRNERNLDFPKWTDELKIKYSRSL